MPNGTPRICKSGHRFYKSSTCPTCPICEDERKPKNSFLSSLAAPARRALENEGLTSLEKISKYSEREILALHGMGPNALTKLKTSLKSAGLSFKK